MAKSIPKIGSCKNGRIGSRKHARKIPKGFLIGAELTIVQVVFLSLIKSKRFIDPRECTSIIDI